MASHVKSNSHFVNMTQYIIDITVEVQNALEEVHKNMHGIKDMKSYAKAVSSIEYTRGLTNGITHIINHMDDDYAFEMLDDMHNHWTEVLEECTAIVSKMRSSYWEGGDVDGRRTEAAEAVRDDQREFEENGVIYYKAQ